jgi:predicted DNA repair protein MutK
LRALAREVFNRSRTKDGFAVSKCCVGAREPSAELADMAADTRLAMFDAIAAVLDHVAVRTKMATEKTAGVLGDDWTLNEAVFAPWRVTLLLVVGGLFPCFEGAQQHVHPLLHGRARDDTQHNRLTASLLLPDALKSVFERVGIGFAGILVASA